MWESITPAIAQTRFRDGIAELIAQADTSNGKQTPDTTLEAAAGDPTKDPRADDKSFKQARELMQAIDAVLKDTANNRTDAKKLPRRDDFLVPPVWTETREDREAKVKTLLNAALAIVTDVPVVDVQKRVEGLRRNIRDLEDRIVELKEKQLTAPEEGVLPGVWSDTTESLANDIEEAKKRIETNRQEIASAKIEISEALRKAGIDLEPDQVDLLLDSVLSGDLVRLVAVFNAAKVIDSQLGKLMAATGDNMKAARKYFAMHAALFALLVHAQDATIAKIDTVYLPKLQAILGDIKAASRRTSKLLRATNRPDQRRALKSNAESQKIAAKAASAYRKYLRQQREQIARARRRATHDLNIADNTFETVEASFQLRNLMRDSAASFEAIQKLEAPTFDQIFKNEELRREFENLTRRLDVPTS
ncbi:MAG: hypothetical protein ACRBCJ_00610 [Hyphomicrobiaceae bacterium]